MSELSGADLAEMGQRIAEIVAQPGTVRLANVRIGTDSIGEQAYYFDFELEEPWDLVTATLDQKRLSRALRDTLIDRGDESYPYVRLGRRQDVNAH